jgi:hypothetical protein
MTSAWLKSVSAAVAAKSCANLGELGTGIVVVRFTEKSY